MNIAILNMIIISAMLSVASSASAEGGRDSAMVSPPAIAVNSLGGETFDVTPARALPGKVTVAHVPTPSLEPRRPLPSATLIREGQPLLAPLAFVRFCDRFPAECRKGSETSQVALDDRLWDLLEEVTVAVNRQIVPRQEEVDDWAPGKTVGDCDAFAVEKRHRLIARGLPAAALSLTEVVARGEPHLVLTVRTDRGSFVLDNLTDRVLPWQRTGHRFVKVQSASRPNYWVAVDGAERPRLDFGNLKLRGSQRTETGRRS